MKSKIKHSLKLSNSILKNRNFLNSQNYILGKNEKNSVMSIFSTNSKIEIFYKFLNILLYFLQKIFLISLLILYGSLIYHIKKYFEFNFITLLVFSSNIPLIIFILIKLFSKNNITKITNTKKYFLSNGKDTFSILLGIVLSIIFSSTIAFLIYEIINKVYGYNFEFGNQNIGILLVLFIVLILFLGPYFLAKPFAKLRLFNLLFFPFFTLFVIIFYIYFYYKNLCIKNTINIIKLNINNLNIINYEKNLNNYLFIKK